MTTNFETLQLDSPEIPEACREKYRELIGHWPEPGEFCPDAAKWAMSWMSKPEASTLTVDQAVTVSAYTGFLACKFSDMQAAVEKKLGRPVWTHEFGSEDMQEKLREAFKDDFLKICNGGARHG